MNERSDYEVGAAGNPSGSSSSATPNITGNPSGSSSSATPNIAEDNSRRAQLIAGEGIVVRRPPLTVAISAAAGNDTLAPLVTTVIDRLVDEGQLTFAPVAGALQAIVVDHQPLGVAALLDAAPEPILFLFDQAQAIEDEPGHDGRPAPELRHGGKGRVGWNTVLATGPQVTLLVGPMDGSGEANPGWAQIREGTVAGCGARIVLSARQAPATATPPPTADSSFPGAVDSAPTAEPSIAASFDSPSFDSAPTAAPIVAASFDSPAFDSATPDSPAFDSAALDSAPPPMGAAQPPPPVGLPAPPPPEADQQESVLWASQPPPPGSQPFPGLPPSPDLGSGDGFDPPPSAGHAPPPDAASSLSQPPGPNPSPPPPGSSALGLPPPGSFGPDAAPGAPDSGADRPSAPIAGPPPMPDLPPQQMNVGGPSLSASGSPAGTPPRRDIQPSSTPPPIPGDAYRTAPPPSPSPDLSPPDPSDEAPPTGSSQSPARSQPLPGTPPMPDGPPTWTAVGDEESDGPKPPDSLP